jgi:hypothetical protein
MVLATPAIAPEAYSSAEVRIAECADAGQGGRTEVELPAGGALREEPLGPFERAELDRDAGADAEQRRQCPLLVSYGSRQQASLTL